MSGTGTFVDAMRATAARPGNTHGIRFYTDERTSTRLTFRDFDERARARAASFQRRGFGPGDVAVLGFNPGIALIESVYAALYAGMAIAPVPVTVGRNPASVVKRIEAIVADSGSRLVLTEAAAASLFDSAALGDVEVEVLGEPGARDGEHWSPPAITPESVALLQYTSGSTGDPKGVVVTHANLVANEEAIGGVLADGEDDVWVGWLPHYHDMGLIGLLFRPIYAGAEAVLTSPSRFLRRPLLWLRLITEHRATTTVAPDFAYRLCSQVVTDEQLAQLDLSSLRVTVTGAEPVRTGTIAQFSARFQAAGFDPASMVPAYGMAETTLIISAAAGREVRAITADVDALENGELRSADGQRAVDLVYCGRPVEGSTVAIVDPDTRERLPDGRIGEIWVASPSVAQGYWGREEATAEVFNQALAGVPGQFLRTGDLGAILDGEVVVAGRLKDLIIAHGRNIFPQDVEGVASSHVGSDPACISAAFALDEQSSDVGVIVELDPRTLGSADLASLTVDLRRTLVAEFGLPSVGIALVRKGTIPRTTSGKVQRRRARRELMAGEMSLAHADGLAIESARPAADVPVP